MKKQILSMVAALLSVSMVHASLGETPEQALERTLSSQKIAIFAETKDISARFKTVGLPFLETLKDAGFNCLVFEAGSLTSTQGIPRGLTYENYELLSWLGFFKDDAKEAQDETKFLESVRRLGYKVSYYKKSSAAMELANKINSRECTRVVAVVDAKAKLSLPSVSIAEALQTSGWNPVSYLLLPKAKIEKYDLTEYSAIFSY